MRGSLVISHGTENGTAAPGLRDEGESDRVMVQQRYRLRISGLTEDEGQIKVATLQRVLDALLKTAERTARLLATGAGSERGAKPRWLVATMDMTFVGLTPGSTVIDVVAPPIGDAARDAFAQFAFWTTTPEVEDTALDLAARAIQEIQEDSPAGDYFDTSVLEAVLEFDKAAKNPDVGYELIPSGKSHESFSLDRRTCARVRKWLARVPPPRPFVISGRLDEIKHGNGRFRLLVDGESALPGRVDGASLSVEVLRPLWGKRTTMEGVVHFKVNGQPRLVEARKISERREGDGLFKQLPVARPASQDLLPGFRRKAAAFDPIDLAGAWPGDEPLDDLLKQLD